MKQQISGWTVGFCAVLLMAGAWMWWQGKAPEWAEKARLRSVYAEATKVVTGQLLSPSTATFAPFTEAQVEGKYTMVVTAYVDSQNEFGGMTRKKFSVEGYFGTDGKWLHRAGKIWLAVSPETEATHF